MKKCKAEYLLIKMILLKSLIYKGCTFYVILFRLEAGENVNHAYITCIWMDIFLSSGRL